MVDDVSLHPELLQQTCTLQCFSCLHRNGFLTVVGPHFIFRHRIGGEVLHNFLLSRNISNFALSRIVDEIANIHWVPVPKLLNLLFEVLDHLRVNKRLFRDRCHISIGGANSAMAKAVTDCFWLHIHAPSCNNNVHSLEDVDLLGVYYLVLKALNEEAIETAQIVSLEASDNSYVARLNLRGRVWWQIEHGCVAECNNRCELH